MARACRRRRRTDRLALAHIDAKGTERHKDRVPEYRDRYQFRSAPGLRLKWTSWLKPQPCVAVALAFCIAGVAPRRRFQIFITGWSRRIHDAHRSASRDAAVRNTRRRDAR